VVFLSKSLLCFVTRNGETLLPGCGSILLS